MPSSIQIGSILIKEQPYMAERLALERDSYSQNWSVVRAVNGFSLDRKIREAGWTSFFMRTELQANAFGPIQAGSLRAALQRIFSKVRDEDFNCLEVTGIVARSFLGIPYLVVSARSRQIQKGWRLDHPYERRAAQSSGVGQRLRRSSSQATIGVVMSAYRKKWCICQVHQPGVADAPYYTQLPQYGPWDTEREAQEVSDLLERRNNQPFALTVRECVDGPVVASVSQIDSITAVDETSLPDQHDTKRKYYEEPLRWQSRVQHD